MKRGVRGPDPGPAEEGGRAIGDRRYGRVRYQDGMDEDGVLVVLTTFPDDAKARQTAVELVERQVAACVNLLPGVKSIYRWQGQVEQGEEVLAVMKTTRGRYGALEKALLELHPYETPELLAMPVEAGAEAYLRWVKDSVK